LGFKPLWQVANERNETILTAIKRQFNASIQFHIPKKKQRQLHWPSRVGKKWGREEIQRPPKTQ